MGHPIELPIQPLQVAPKSRPIDPLGVNLWGMEQLWGSYRVTLWGSYGSCFGAAIGQLRVTLWGSYGSCFGAAMGQLWVTLWGSHGSNHGAVMGQL